MPTPRKEPQDDTKTMPQYYRLQIRIIKMAKEKATQLGMKMPAYISQLIVKDCKR